MINGKWDGGVIKSPALNEILEGGDKDGSGNTIRHG